MHNNESNLEKTVDEIINEACSGESSSICCKKGVIAPFNQVIQPSIKNIEPASTIGRMMLCWEFCSFSTVASINFFLLQLILCHSYTL